MPARMTIRAAMVIAATGVLLSLPISVPANDDAPSDIGFSGLATFDIQVRDRGEAIEWFSRVLGFEHLFTAEEMNWAEVRSPVARVTIGIEEIRDRPIRSSSIDFGVMDIEVARKAIEERGGVFEGETKDYGPVIIARLRDPSGNMFNLFQGK